MKNVILEYIGHSGIFYAVYSLFYERLGYNVFVLDFDDEQWCSFFNLQKSNLSVHDQTLNGFKEDCNTGENIKRLKYNEFLSLDIDYIVTTNQEREQGYYNLLKLKPNAKFIRQLGNNGEKPKFAKNVLLTKFKTEWSDNPEFNTIRYIGEHPSYFKPDFDIPKKDIVGCYNYVIGSGFQPAVDNLNRLNKSLQGKYRINLFGGEKFLKRWELPEILNKHKFFFHMKPFDDGYMLREALSCGLIGILNSAWWHWLPYTTNLQLYYCKDKVNFIDVNPEVRSWDEAMELILEYGDDSNYLKKSKEAYEYTKSKLDWENQIPDIKEWLNNL